MDQRPTIEPARTAERYLWAPTLHRLVGESCHFFIFTTVDSRGALLKERLLDLHREMGIFGATAYVLQGPYDLMLRMWLTPVRRQAYMTQLESRQADFGLEAVYEFETKSAQVYYSWEKAEHQRTLAHELDERYVDGNLTHDDLVEKVHESGLPIPDAIPQLIESHWLIPVFENKGTRVFCFISELDPGRQKDSKTHHLISEYAAAAGFVDTSMYVGRAGFCSFILKGFVAADNPQRVLNAISDLQDSLAQSGLAGWTLTPFSCDFLDTDEALGATGSKPFSIASWVMAIDRADAVDLDKLDSALAKPAVERFVNEYTRTIYETAARNGIPDQLANRLGRRLLSLIAGVLTGDRKRVNREASFLVTTDSDLRRILEARHAIVPVEQSAEIAFSSLLKSDAQLAQRCASRLGEMNVTDTLAVTRAIRETFVSGLLFEDLYEQTPGDRLRSELDDLGKSATLQIALEEVRKELEVANRDY